MIVFAAATLATALTAARGAQTVPLSFEGLSLSAAQSQAVAESPEVAAARARLMSAGAVLRQQRGALGPSLLAGYTENPQAGPGPSTISQHSTSVGVQTVIGNVLAYSPRVAGAAREYQAAQADEYAAERAERVKAAGLYYAALKARATLSARSEGLRLAADEEQAAAKRFQAGDAPRIDVVRAAVTVARATADEATAKAADDNATDALRLETGAGDSAFARTSAKADQATSVGARASGPAVGVPGSTASNAVMPGDQSDVESAVALALEQRPEIASAQRGVGAAAAMVAAARRAAVPALVLGAGYARGVDSGQKVAGPTLNAQLELPLTAAASSGIAGSQASLAEAQAKLAGQRRDIAVEVGAAVRNLAAAGKAVSASTKAREQAQAELAATQLGYRSGASSSLERASAQATYADARLNELAAIYDQALARAVVALDTGR
ncbi:MAG: TolC family protein [Candidatus Eremiobacteraeota bacterium]|nr:TolC family protein [Candidatus Eremiobacteraeota bacterium]